MTARPHYLQQLGSSQKRLPKLPSREKDWPGSSKSQAEEDKVASEMLSTPTCMNPHF